MLLPKVNAQTIVSSLDLLPPVVDKEFVPNTRESVK